MVEAGLLEAKAGRARLLDRSELADDWDPRLDHRLAVWEVTQRLIRALDGGGESSAAALLRAVGGLGEGARELSYRLFVICERKKWAKEAMPYNALVIAWPEIARLAAGAPDLVSAQQRLL
jgi:putative DNA methylase